MQLVFREGLGLPLCGTALRVLGVLALGRYIASQLYGVVAVNPWLMLVAAVSLLVIAGIACAIPARCASRIDAIRAFS